MKKIRIILLAVLLVLSLFILNSCAGTGVSVGVGIYAPGAWGPYGGYRGGYYPPVGIGYPIY